MGLAPKDFVILSRDAISDPSESRVNGGRLHFAVRLDGLP
jgi:hypothetical protein